MKCFFVCFSLGIFSLLKFQMIILNFLVCYTMIKCTSKVLTSLLSNKKSKQMLLRSVGRWSPGQLLAPSSWRSLNPPWLGYFFSFQWKITQRDPSAPFSYSHQVSKEWKDNLTVPHFQNPGVDSLILLTKLPKIGVQTIMMAKVQTASQMKSEKKSQIMWSYSG